MYSNNKMLPSPLIYYPVKPLLCISFETKSWEKVSLMLSLIISWMLGEPRLQKLATSHLFRRDNKELPQIKFYYCDRYIKCLQKMHGWCWNFVNLIV